ncbi:glycerate kinase family protein [Shouchella clausii]|uniref:glycerate kinase family protein n=1 Tax=Shouchella clausii TaxID=79880 RepID=UPI002706FDD6|nr:glycerate kinase [Shouchella clausii]MDO7269702.1 glycerate kinase [Shouchella clausii]MDO7289672.1 glycerate kinase [Shouchella clausii]
MQKISIAPDSFKESLTALQAAQAIKAGFKRVFPHAIYECIPMADGGEGTVQSLADALGATIRTATVTGPLGNQVEAAYAFAKKEQIAVIEMAAASGLHLVPKDKRDPRKTTTFGTGELIKDALEQGAKRIILGLGGSATNDGGAGCAQALGIRLEDAEGKELQQGCSPLIKLARIRTETKHPLLADASLEIACDVDNPLLGPKGASAIYGPQKGATQEMIAEMERALTHYAAVIKQQLGKSVQHIAGAGAAGGLGAGLLAFFQPRIESGVTLVLEATGFHKRIAGSELVVTGEGRLDSQTPYGKTPIGVAKAAKAQQIPVIAVAGQLGDGYEAIFDHGIDAAFSLVPGAIPLDDAIANGAAYLEAVAEQIARTYALALENNRND